MTVRLSSGPRRRPGRAGGFTLIELMFTIALAGILTGLAAPSITKMLKTNRVQTEASSLRRRPDAGAHRGRQARAERERLRVVRLARRA